MFGAAAGVRIQKRILVREIVEATLGNDFDNRQRLITENTDGQFAPGNEFLDQQLARRIRPLPPAPASNSSSLLHDVDADGRTLARRLDDERQRHRRSLRLSR